MDKAASIGEAVMVVLSSLVVIAIIAVIVSGSATTVSVLQAFTQSFTAILSTIVSPITSGSASGSSGSNSAGTGVGGSLGFGGLVQAMVSQASGDVSTSGAAQAGLAAGLTQYADGSIG